MTRLSALKLSLVLASSWSACALAQDAPQEPQADGGAAIIVTGTRLTGMKAADSPAPIQLLGADAIQRTGSPDIIQSLAQNLPSVQAQAFGSDLQAHNLQMKLRGLSPNHTLILVNGKRRHGTANVSVAGGPYGGSAAPDISFISPDSIERVEVLQDGAAAQYGTDAIAGVINFIQKKRDHGGSLNATAGEYYDGGGRTYAIGGDIGLAPFEGAYLNIAAQKKRKGYSFRGDVNPEATSMVGRYPAIADLPGYPYTNRIAGDPQINQTIVSYNAGYEFGEFEAYSFGSYGHKKARAWENTRNPTVISKTVDPDGSFVAPADRNGNETTVLLYPGGFQPREMIDETDYSFTGGFKGMVGATSFDIASTYGKDIIRVHVENSGNSQLYRDTGFTPTEFHNGDFIGTQWSNTLDLTHQFDVGLAEPINIAGGLEYRRETYEIVSGDPASYYGAGAQSFFGYSPNDAGKYTRKNFSQYLDISLKPTENWLVDGAVRHEHYSDFGDTTVFKLTSRYDFSDAIAVRGTVSTGFRAPTLAEGGYSGINVGPSGISGVLPASSAAAQSLGFGGLKPEKSTNFSAGLVLNPLPKLTVTLDAYHITIRDRIVISSSFYGFRGPFCPAGYRESGAFDANRCNAFNAAAYALNNQQAVLDAVRGALGGEIPTYVLENTNGTRNIDGSVSVQTFANGVKMRTTGVDLVANYSTNLGDWGNVDWSYTANYNKNKVLNVAAPPSTLNVAGAALIDRYSIAQLENSTPKFRATLGAYWSLGKFSANLRESYYSSVYALEVSAGNGPLAGADTRVYAKAAFVTDLELGYKIAEPIKLTIGANNLFNKYPTERSYANIRGPQLAGNSRTYSTNLYPNFSPYGINGGYYYARINVNW
ncbi:TonB-dependent receptor [Sphingobium sp. BYY-5]|uniref:TonB-dependent receptor plug domain-containing protein n=1 Tax=Sphingobium sp. BYY-5 TaxID=2926400 RepID=UPI001FA7E8B6|nr:TonB-dependent receptor [Sphingobium sp. BYY-5]MCI4591534.1 TonB-dependent receptor [Sphingobium sp. BYY-5]